MNLKKIACAIICDKDKSLFYMQQKDESYHREKYRLYYFLFGGSLEENESEADAIKRELKEELSEFSSEVVINKLGNKFNMDVFEENILKKLTFFIFYLTKEELKSISNEPVFEGKKGEVLEYKDFDIKKVMPTIKKAIDQFKSNKNL